MVLLLIVHFSQLENLQKFKEIISVINVKVLSSVLHLKQLLLLLSVQMNPRGDIYP